MENLTELFEQRDKFFSEKTHAIFSQIGNTLGCVTAYLTDTDDIISQGIVSWEDVSLVDDMIVVIGMVQYEIGGVVTFEGETTTITEDNVDLFQRVVHMSVPFPLVEEDNEDTIMAFLYSLGADQDIGEFATSFAPPPAAVKEEDFDLSDLSESQIQSLKHSPKSRDN